MRRAIMWFRRDLRLSDHPALWAAAEAEEVVALFVDDPRFGHAGAPRRAYLRAALSALDDSIDGALVIRRGDPTDVVAQVAGEVGAADVYVSRDYGRYGRERDAAVAQRVALHGIGSPYAHAPGSVRKQDGTPYRVFTPFAKAWRALPLAAPRGVPVVRWHRLPSDGLPSAEEVALPAVGERAASERWQEFLGHVDRYRDERDRPAVPGTSRLSADLRWGVVHPRRLLSELPSTVGGDAFATELAWREFYADVLFEHPEAAWRDLDARFEAMPVDTDGPARRRFEVWAAGRTGFPIVDAGMRQLLATGWMHNRVRMITASFLVKDLHLPWQWGARHFMQHLIDGDLASNNLGWQWVAGSGTDAAPYFRVFNPNGQADRFDPDREYVRRWVPELGTADYPGPMVDHAAERAEALGRYQQIRASSR